MCFAPALGRRKRLHASGQYRSAVGANRKSPGTHVPGGLLSVVAGTRNLPYRTELQWPRVKATTEGWHLLKWPADTPVVGARPDTFPPSAKCGPDGGPEVGQSRVVAGALGRGDRVCCGEACDRLVHSVHRHRPHHDRDPVGQSHLQRQQISLDHRQSRDGMRLTQPRIGSGLT